MPGVRPIGTRPEPLPWPRRLRRWLLRLVVACVVLVAVLVALASRLLPLLDERPELVGQWLQQRIGVAVELDRVETRWNRAGPRLALSGLRIGTGPARLEMHQARLQVNIYAGLWPGIPWTELRLSGSQLELHRAASGEWSLEGFGERPVRTATTTQFEQLERFGAIELVDARLSIEDAVSGRQRQLERINARLLRRGRSVHFGLIIEGDGGGRLRVAGEVRERGRAGTVYIEGLGQDWAAWLAAESLQGLVLDEGRGDLRLWLDFADGQARRLQLDASLGPLQLHREAVAGALPGGPARRASIDASHLLLRVERTDQDSWNLLVPSWERRGAGRRDLPWLRDLGIGRDASGLLRVEAARVRLQPLLALAGLAPQLPGGLADWLGAAQPDGTLENLHLAWIGPDQYLVGGLVGQLGWAPADRVPGLRGLSGTLDGDARALRLQVGPGTWELDAPGVFRTAFVPQVQGELLWFDSGAGWRLDTPGLQLQEEDYGITLAGGAQWLPAGGVLLDLRADVATGPVVAAKRFWPLNVMPVAARRWLDAALLDGEVRSGKAIARGLLADWPYRHGEGRFEARAELGDLELLYHGDWPRGHQVAGEARFINQGMAVDLTGRIGTSRLRSVRGGVADFSNAALDLDIAATGPLPGFIDVLRQSPLQEGHGRWMEAFELSGTADAAFRLQVPLEDDAPAARVRGRVDVQAVDLRDVQRDFRLEAITGRVRFTENGFAADELVSRFGGAVAMLSLAVGEPAAASGQALEASLRGRFSAADLPIPGTEQITAWLSGTSEWSLRLSSTEDPLSSSSGLVLQAESDLLGTRILLPAPLRKAAAGAMPLVVRAAFNAEGAPTGLDMHLGHLLQLRGQADQQGTFRGVAAFGSSIEDDLPARGWRVVGQVPTLDVTAWTDLLGEGPGSSAGLAASELFVGELSIFGRRFREVQLSLRPADDGFEIGLGGEALAGSVLVPAFAELAQRGITARFERLHWPDDEDEEEPIGPPAPGFSPQLIPPIHLESADTRFAGAHWGNVWLETHPVANGMRVERLDAHSPAFDLKGEGDWLLLPGGERSRIVVDFSSRNAGGMLEELGYSRLLETSSAHGNLRLDWPGTPAAFDWGQVDGALQVDLGQGRILEVEPGAGRLFGLLSLTEIPRRLSLDFSDFFQTGFAFNAMGGHFEIDRGSAQTDDFRIDAPAARMRLTGRTNIKTRQYDQHLEVVPRAGSVLPAIGALAGGPAGVAVGVVAQAVLSQPLKEMTRIVYRITGPWDEPDIAVIERGPPAGETP